MLICTKVSLETYSSHFSIDTHPLSYKGILFDCTAYNRNEII